MKKMEDEGKRMKEKSKEVRRKKREEDENTSCTTTIETRVEKGQMSLFRIIIIHIYSGRYLYWR